MTKDSKNVPGKLHEVAVAASTTCTRSGAFALLLSVALFTMIPYWLHRAEQVALANYVALRLSLAGAVDTLDGSTNWNTYKASNPDAESMTVAQLLKVRVKGDRAPPSTSSRQKEPLVSGGGAGLPRGAPGKPNPPTGLQAAAASGIAEMWVIEDLLVKLDDSDLLTKSRNVSPFYNYSIFRWAIKRHNLLSRNLASSSEGVVLEASPEQNARDNFVPSWGKDWVLNNLTVSRFFLSLGAN